MLALRGMGADPSLRDSAGRAPLDYLMETWGGMPRSVTPEEREKFSQYGFRVPVPFSRKKDGSPETRFVSVAGQVDNLEGKRYFTLCAEALSRARESGFSVPDMAAGDQVGRPTDPQTELLRNIGMSGMDRLREQNRAKGQPLWKSIVLESGTGAAMAKFKCLFPEAYPATITYFSSLLAGKEKDLSLDAEWSAWDVPDTLRVALMMQTLQDRLQKSRAKAGKPQDNRSNTFTLGGGGNLMHEVTRTYRERGDAPQARNPLLMVWTLLEHGKPDAKNIPDSLNLSPTPPSAEYAKAEDKGKHAKAEDRNTRVRELPNLLGLHARLPREAWRDLGRYLLAAAYVAEKGQEGQWASALMPSSVKNAGGLEHLRLWGNEDKTDPAEPLRRVIEASISLPPDLATAMTALVLRSSPGSTARGKDGQTPLEYARSLSGNATPAVVPKGVTALLRAAPVYEPSAEAVPEEPVPGKSSGSEANPSPGGENPRRPGLPGQGSAI